MTFDRWLWTHGGLFPGIEFSLSVIFLAEGKYLTAWSLLIPPSSATKHTTIVLVFCVYLKTAWRNREPTGFARLEQLVSFITIVVRKLEMYRELNVSVYSVCIVLWFSFTINTPMMIMNFILLHKRFYKSRVQCTVLFYYKVLKVLVCIIFP